MQTTKFAIARLAVALSFALSGAAAAADGAAKPVEDSGKTCCRHARATEGKSAEKCAKPAEGEAKACCAKHEAKAGQQGGDCCCEKSCDRKARQAEPARG